MFFVGLKGQKYQLEAKPFNSGGEGEIYRIVGNKNRVVKIYKGGKSSKSLEEKLTIMANRPPAASVLNQVAWPVDVVYDSSHNFKGFVMPKLDITSVLSEIYVYPPKTNITYEQKLIIAQNICAVIHEVHKAGYVFGDFNPRNIGINLNTGTVAFLDTDTYHIVVNKAANKAYRCNVCAPGYAAPELLEKCAKHISAHPEDRQQAYAKTPLDTFTKETDNFALAIHMFRLMMNGYTPYNGIKETDTVSTASPGVGDDAVKRDNYCFKMGNKPQAVAVPDLNAVPKGISKLYHLAFVEGKKDPSKRPSAYDWYQAIGSYENELVKCSKNGTHMYRRGLALCPWCAADERYRQSISKSATTGSSMPQKPLTTPVAPPPATRPAPQPVSSSRPVTTSSGSATSSYNNPKPTNLQDKKKTLRTVTVLSNIAYFALIAYIAYFIFIDQSLWLDTTVISLCLIGLTAVMSYSGGATYTGFHGFAWFFNMLYASAHGSIILYNYYYRDGLIDNGYDEVLLDMLGASGWFVWKLCIATAVVSAIIIKCCSMIGESSTK